MDEKGTISLLRQMTLTTPTCFWNDSCAIGELGQSIRDGAVGATCNPVIVLEVLSKEWDLWRDRIGQLIRELPTGSEEDVSLRLVQEMSIKAASLLEPVYRREGGRNGRLSIQTDPRLYRNAAAIVQQAVQFHEMAPNIIVKIPATRAGIEAIEEATRLGVSVNATVSFSVPQAIAVAEAVEKGLKHRESEGKDTGSMGPVCTIMVGRLDDWLKSLADTHNIITNPGVLEWPGVAVMKKAYQIYRARGYRLRLLSAAFRNHLHWSEFIGGDVVISPPWKWQQRFNASDVKVEPHMEQPVNPAILEELDRKFEDFRRAYREDGLSTAEFEGFGPTVRTLRQFCQAAQDLSKLIREQMLHGGFAERGTSGSTVRGRGVPQNA